MPDNDSGQKFVLGLDGGGVRGVITLAFLERIEAILGAGDPAFRLAHRFDLIGGTSTGAIIATGLALGLRASELKAIYFRLAPRVFARSRFRVKLIQSLFDATALEEEIHAIVGDLRIESANLRTGLAIVMKRLDTGSPWLISNNPGSRYWDDPADGSHVGNRHFRIADLLRASTAAPYYFAPHEVAIVEGAPPGLFVDGGVTPHNNPILALLQLVTVPAYGFGWPVGERSLHFVSIGTGLHRQRLSAASARRTPAVALAVEALRGMSNEAGDLATTTMELLGRTDTSWPINGEAGDLQGFRLTREPLFTFQRYNVRLDREWLRSELGLVLDDGTVERLTQLDNAGDLALLHEIGTAAAERFVRPEHFATPSAP